MIKLDYLIDSLEKQYPLSWQENYDNCGLQVGDPQKNINKVLCCLDCSAEVVAEAIATNCDLIICHHPIIFSPLYNVNTQGNGQLINQLIKQDIAVYAMHTNVDNAPNSINELLANKIGLKNTQKLACKKQPLQKIICFSPVEHANKIHQALSIAGAGQIGNYSQCAFSVNGTGTFKPQESAQPFIGKNNELTTVEEVRIEMIFSSCYKQKVISALLAAHPYEMPAYDIVQLDQYDHTVGAGITGILQNEITPLKFLSLIKEKLNLTKISYSGDPAKIKKIAIVSGSGFDYFKDAKQQNVDAFISADIKYHQFIEASTSMLLCDIGHFESEVIVKELFCQTIHNINKHISVSSAQKEINYVKYFY